MKNQVTRTKPDSANMVTQAGPNTHWSGLRVQTIEMLCTECGWEGTCSVPTAPWTIFKDHPCRLIVQSISTGF